MNFSVGDLIRVEKCEKCPAVVGKTARISGFTADVGVVTLNFGRGRPRLGQPKSINVNDISMCDSKVVDGDSTDENSSS